MNREVKWDLRMLGLARHVSTWSKDPSTKVGAVIFTPEYRIVSVGYNGMAKGVSDDKLEDRERKYKTIIHGEINALLFAQSSVKGCTLATWPFMSCSNCSSIMIQAGIKRCIFPALSEELRIRWEESLKLSYEQFGEAGVECVEYKVEDIG